MANEGDLVDEENGENMEAEICDGRGKKRVYEPGNSGRCSKVASKKKYSKKRRFHGNQNTTNLNQKLKKQYPASLKKVKSIRNLSHRKKLEGDRLFDVNTQHLRSVHCLSTNNMKNEKVWFRM